MSSKSSAARVVARHSLKPPLRSSKGRAEDELRAGAAYAAERTAGLRPAGRAAAGHVAVAEHEVGLARVEDGEHLGQLLGRVREVRVHLADRAVAAVEA